MSPLKALPLTKLLFFTFFIFQQLQSQQPIYNRIPDARKMGVNPSNVRVLDSLRLINEVRFHNRPVGAPFKMVGNTMPLRITQAPSLSRINLAQKSNSGSVLGATALTGTVCYTVSGRDFLKNDSLVLYTNDPCMTADGNVIVPGEFAYYSPYLVNDGGFCMKTDINGNVIWAKLIDSVNVPGSYDFLYYFKSVELKSGHILLAGRTQNRVSGNDDLVLTMLDNNGNMIWSKTYESKFWQGFNGSGDLFGLKTLTDDPATGEIYFAGYHWTGISTITKVDPLDGHIIWSTGYESYDDDRTFGMIINTNNLLLFYLGDGSYGGSYVNAIAINKTNGDTLYSKHYRQISDVNSTGLYSAYEAIKLNNGHYRLSGPTIGYYEYPTYTGTKDLYHAGIIELDENLNFVKAWEFKNRVQGNSYNTMVSMFPDGSGVFTMLDVKGSFVAEAHVSVFKDDVIYHQRKRLHNNEGLPYEPPTLQLADGGYLNVKLMGDSTKTGADGSRVDYYRMHTSDTASLCLGVPDSVTSVSYINYEPVMRSVHAVDRDVFRESRVKTFSMWDFKNYRTPACTIISNCDTLHLGASATTVCPGSNVTFTIHKNAACGSLVPLTYDTNFVRQVTKLTDTTYRFRFDVPGNKYIQASLMGCQLRKDSVFIQVIPARNSLDLGPDTVLCPGNEIKLNAGEGFASYAWQDGSTDSTFSVTASGKYYVTANNSCGTVFSDTVVVNDHPPIPISIGPDRFKCNNDTLNLMATPGFMNYSWSSNYNISSVNAQQVVVDPLVDTIYTVKAEKTPGCFAFDTVRITVKTSPAIYLGKDTSICSHDTLMLDAGTGFANYVWNTGDNQQQIKISQAGVYWVKASTTDGCSSYDTLKLLSLYQLPQPDLGADSVICKGQYRILGSHGNYDSYRWSTGAISSTITIDTAGEYWLVVKDAHGCLGTDTTVVPAVVAPPSVYLGNDTAICSYGYFRLQPQGHYNRYLWSTGSVGNSLTIMHAGSYWLEVSDQNNCKARDTILVSQKDCLEGLYVPNAFTPNGDGTNDTFKPVILGDVKSFTFQIFNRWGELVYQTSTPGNGWNGIYKGRNQDTNVFLWICIYQLNGKQPEKRSGTVTLIR